MLFSVQWSSPSRRDMSEILIIKTPSRIQLIQPTRIGDLQLIYDRRGDVLPLRLLQRDCQPVHQGSHQSLLVAGAGGDRVPVKSLITNTLPDPPDTTCAGCWQSFWTSSWDSFFQSSSNVSSSSLRAEQDFQRCLANSILHYGVH